MDWWFDIDNTICCARMEERNKALSFEGEIRPHLSEIKPIKNGKTAIYIVEPHHVLVFNDVIVRGERYVSLYLDGTLIKEYNVRAERAKEKHMRHAELFETSRAFVRTALGIAFAVALFVAVLSVAVLSVFGIFDSIASVAICTVVFAAAGCIVLFCALGIIYMRVRSELVRYALVSGVKKGKKSVRKRHVRRKYR